MKKFLIALAIILLITCAAEAANLLDTSFNCAEQDAPFTCESVQVPNWSITCTGTEVSEIEVDSNNPLGSGNGLRQWSGVGKNVDTGPPTAYVTNQTHIWVRYYMKFQSGFAWGARTNIKLLYTRYGSGYGNAGYYFEFDSGSNNIRVVSGSVIAQSASNTGFNYVNGGATGDGLWHLYEFEISLGNPGILRVWIDEELLLDATPNLTQSNICVLQPIANADSPNNSPCRYIDFDDFAISNTARIGGLSSSDDTTPNAFYFNSVLNASLSTQYTSNPITVAGINATTTVSMEGGTYSKNGGAYTSSSGTAVLGDTFTVRQTSSGSNATTTNAVLTIGGVSGTFAVTTVGDGGSNLLLSESFENNSFASRGWTDNSQDTTTSGGYSGNCLQWAWGLGETTPTDGGSMRHAFTATETLYVKAHVKFQSGWRGSQVAYHPHLIYIPSDADYDFDEFGGLAGNFLQTYIEFLSQVGSPYSIYPQIEFQDKKRVNTSYGTPPVDIKATTEDRSTFYCNQSVGAEPYTNQCYNDGSGWYSANTWIDSVHTLSTNAWHKVEAYFKMNTISGGIGQEDGIMRVWVDGALAIERTNMLLRTNQYPTMKWRQIVFAPWIGDGSPIAQTMWIDELEIRDEMPTGDITAPMVAISTSDPSNITTNSLTVTGTATEETGVVTSVKYCVGAAPDGSNGTPCTCDDGTCNEASEAFTCTTSGYSVGANTLYVGATEGANWGSDSITVNKSSASAQGCTIQAISGQKATVGSGGTKMRMQ